MLLIVEKAIRCGVCQEILRYAEANNKYMKNYDKNIVSSYLMYLVANNFCEWVMSQKLTLGGFRWVKRLSKFDEFFIKNYDENSNNGYFLEVDAECPKNLFHSHTDFTFLPEREKIKRCGKLFCHIKEKKLLFT